MADVIWDQAYPIAEAERSKFVPIDTSTLTNYPSSGRGKHAVITYNMGSDPGAPGASSSNPSFVSLVDTDGEPVTISENVGGTGVNAINVRIAESVTTLSAFQIDATGVSGLDIQASIKYPDTTVYQSVTVPANTLSTITFPRQMLVVETFNNSQDNTLYIGFNSTTLAVLSSTGLPIQPESFYSIDRMTTNIYLGNASSSPIDARVIGHYRNI
jgi:hypothetical protein